MNAALFDAYFKHSPCTPLLEETDSAFVLTSRENKLVRYGIPKKKITTPESILRCIDHLAPKNWITTAHLRAFIAAASKYLGVEIDKT